MCTQTLLYILYSTFHLTCYLPSNKGINNEFLISQRENDKNAIHSLFLSDYFCFMIHPIPSIIVLSKEF